MHHHTLSKWFFSLALVSVSSFADAKEVLRMLAWPGYADQDLVEAFEKKYDVTVETTIVSSDDEMWDKLNSSAEPHFDVFAVNTAELQRYIPAGLSVPINRNNIPNQHFQLPQFQKVENIPGIVKDGKLYAVPYAYSEMGLIYNKKLVKTPPTSMTAMWDPKYKGKVLAFNGSAHNFSMTALTLGIADPFHLNNVQFGEVVKRVASMRKNVLNYYNLPEEAVDLFMHHNIALIYANYGTQQVKMLKDQGADIGYIIPAEGALAWLDCWAITSKVQNKALAEAWINYAISKPVSQRLSTRYGLSNTVSYSKPQDEHAKIVWLEPVEDADKRTRLWERIVTGYRKGVQ
ncbi:extracellular solute-binding protein [Leeia oryzae]|uniref:extracellular solute-binding protein n=1 Tax=Leeia oryzae TaxID=356662 RepID=UPI000369BB6A|nr:extracellular solute-binding protein [Leeia oryzae]